ncbi:EamA family transporter [Pedobacter sp. UC225_65]|uniref:EamA family transporter n=1 Tax=Pedobacter sp. UC225_65 TaxID=3350173 RepID=UPI0036710813
MANVKKPAPLIIVYLAFAIVYVVWGSTYFFIQKALAGFPPFILGTFRFIVAGLLLIDLVQVYRKRDIQQTDH